MRTGERSLYPRLRCRLSPHYSGTVPHRGRRRMLVAVVGRSPTVAAGDLRNVTGWSPSITLLSIASDQRLPSSRLVANSIALLLRTPGRTVRKRGQFSPIPHGKRPRLRTPGRTVRKGGHSRCGMGPQDAIRRARSFEHACRQRHSHSTPRFSTATSARTAPKSMALTKLLLLPRHPRNVESTRNPIARKQMTKEGRVHYVIV